MPNAWIEGKGLEDIQKPPAVRGDRKDLFYNCFIKISGVEDKLIYANELYQFYLSMRNESRRIVIVNGSIPNPSMEEIQKIRRGNYINTDQLIGNLQSNIQYPPSKILQALLKRAFAEVMTTGREASWNES